jgi:hypothetical protein
MNNHALIPVHSLIIFIIFYNSKNMRTSSKTFPIFILSLCLTSFSMVSSGQTPPSDVLQNGTLSEQLDFVQNRTIIYDNFRAIREDMFQTIKRNSLDSLQNAKSNLQDMSAQMNSRKREIDSLSTLLSSTRNELNQAVENRDNIVFLGMPMNKMSYNLFVWVAIGSLSILLILGMLLYNRNRNITVQTLDEVENLKKDFEDYKVSSRERREKLVMEHFNEIKKLKESEV